MSLHVDDQAASYAFGALGARENKHVEAHLRECAACAVTVREAELVATLLPYAVTPYRAPTDSKAALLERLGHVTAPLAPVEIAPQQVARAPMEETDGAQTADEGWWRPLLLQALPWAAAAIGWAVALALLSYSHGQSDRVNTTQQDFQGQISGLSDSLQRAQAIDSYLYTPGIRVLPLIYAAGVAPHTTLTLYYARGYAHALLMARGLAVLPSNRAYRIWARTRSGGNVPLGRLLTSGGRAEGATLIATPRSLDRYATVGLSLEDSATQIPAHPVLIFRADLPLADKPPHRAK